MKIIRDIIEIQNMKLKNTVLALGKFDGVHRGHYKIMEKLCDEKANGYTSLVFTFSGNPLYNDKSPGEKKIFTEEEQMLVYEKLGIDIIVIYPLESGILNMEPEQFVSTILVKQFGVKKVVCGENFRFGKNRTGDVELLRMLGESYGYETEAMPMLSYDGKIISSTAIRQLVKGGALDEAEKMLGHRYMIVGRVVHGNEIGRTMNTPTANIIPHSGKLLPPNGVYVSLCNIDGKLYRGVTNIGYKPTIKANVRQIGVETHFLDYHGDLYGKILEIELICFTRPEKKFDSTEELGRQLQIDKDMCRNSTA